MERLTNTVSLDKESKPQTKRFSRNRLFHFRKYESISWVWVWQYHNQLAHNNCHMCKLLGGGFS